MFHRQPSWFMLCGLVALLPAQSIAQAPPAPNYSNLELWRGVLTAEAVTCLAFAPDGQSVAGGSQGNVWLWDTQVGELTQALEGHEGEKFEGWVLALAFAPDGKTVATAGADKTVRLWDVATGKLLHTLSGHTDAVRSVAFAPDGQTLASGSDDHTVRLWHAATGAPVRTLAESRYPVTALAFADGGKTLAALSGTQAFAAGALAVLRWDAATGALASEHTMPNPNLDATLAAFAPDGHTVAVGIAGRGNEVVKLWDTATGQLRRTLKLAEPDDPNGVRSVAFAPDGRTLATGWMDHHIKLWDTASGALIGTLPTGDDLVIAVAFAPGPAAGAPLLAGASGGRSVQWWHAPMLAPTER